MDENKVKEIKTAESEAQALLDTAKKEFSKKIALSGESAVEDFEAQKAAATCGKNSRQF